MSRTDKQSSKGNDHKSRPAGRRPLNEAPIINPLSFRVNENAVSGTVLGVVQASDPDAGQSVTYAFNNANPGPFSIDPNTGVLTVTGPIDAARTAYDFSVEVVDDPPTTALFKPVVNYAVGDGPEGVVTGDMNGDGHLDLAVSCIHSNDVAVLLGDGAGHFNPATNFAVGGSSPGDLAVGDLDGDGHFDLVTADASSDNLSVMLGDGLGNFASPTTLNVASPESVVIDDLNGDGYLDLAAATPNSDTISVLLGNGTGNFESANLFGVGNPYSITTGDFNNDGDLDIAVTHPNTNRFSFLLGNGAGDFGSPHDFGTGLYPESLAVGDLDQDGNLDIVIGNYYDNSVSVFLGDGTGSFNLVSNYAVGTDVGDVFIADLNNDGHLDLGAANYDDNNISVLLGDGAGSFGSAYNFPTGNGPRAFAVGDFNEDGYPDVVVLDRRANTVSVLISNPPITVEANMHVTVNHRPVVRVNAVPDHTVREGSFAFPYPAVFDDSDGDALVQTIIPGANAGAVGSNGTYIFGTATEGRMDIQLAATDPDGLTAVAPFRINTENPLPEPERALDRNPLPILLFAMGGVALCAMLFGIIAYLLYRGFQKRDSFFSLNDIPLNDANEDDSTSDNLDAGDEERDVATGDGDIDIDGDSMNLVNRFSQPPEAISDLPSSRRNSVERDISERTWRSDVRTNEEVDMRLELARRNFDADSAAATVTDSTLRERSMGSEAVSPVVAANASPRLFAQRTTGIASDLEGVEKDEELENETSQGTSVAFLQDN